MWLEFSNDKRSCISNEFIAEQEFALLNSANNKENDLLAILFSMGFENTEENLKALRKANNDVDQAVNYLIEEKVPYEVINNIRETDFLEEAANLRRRYQELSELSSINNNLSNQQALVYNRIIPSGYILQNYNGTNSILIDNNDLGRYILQQQQQPATAATTATTTATKY